ncbi:MAG: C10 family peptidase [Candidatus Cryptobacteroides sp.]
MMNPKALILCVLLCVISACTRESELDIADKLNAESSTDNIHAIPIESALEYLNAFISENTETKSSAKRNVASILPIKYHNTVTKSEQDSLDCDNLLYVANFENDGGYAILAADNRIQERVLAIADEGSMSDATIYTALELANEEQQRQILDGYPTTGPGFVTSEETGDEVFMNPNTVILYDENVNDTFVGNFGLDDLGAEDLSGNPIDKSRNEGFRNLTPPEILTSTMCVEYALNEIREGEDTSNNLENPQDTLIDGEIGTQTRITEETLYSDWNMLQGVSPILSDFTNWKQSSPFNDLYPMRRKYILVGKRRKAPAGCFPLAIAKIMTYFEYPANYTHNGYPVDWKELKNTFESEVGSLSAAHLLKGISSGCNSWYFYQGTFTFPSKATSFMRYAGISNAHSYCYSFEKVKGMIDNGCPLIIYSVPGVRIFHSHSWNIDGYKIKGRTITTNTYVNGRLNDTQTRTETCKMVHCDFGWQGECNGYYVSGIFKLNDARMEGDPGSESNQNTNYNNLLKVITYDKPL